MYALLLIHTPMIDIRSILNLWMIDADAFCDANQITQLIIRYPKKNVDRELMALAINMSLQVNIHFCT